MCIQEIVAVFKCLKINTRMEYLLNTGNVYKVYDYIRSMYVNQYYLYLYNSKAK